MQINCPSCGGSGRPQTYERVDASLDYLLKKFKACSMCLGSGKMSIVDTDVPGKYTLISTLIKE